MTTPNTGHEDQFIKLGTELLLSTTKLAQDLAERIKVLEEALTEAQDALSSAKDEMDKARPIKGSEDYVAFECSCLMLVEDALKSARAALNPTQGKT